MTDIKLLYGILLIIASVGGCLFLYYAIDAFKIKEAGFGAFFLMLGLGCILFFYHFILLFIR